MTEETLRAIATGIGLAVAFNPLASVIATPVAAALLSGLTGPGCARRGWAIAVLAFGWFVGDGLQVLFYVRDVGHMRDALDMVGGTLQVGSAVWEQYTALALWVAGGLALGYALPAWAGSFVGRRVTHGTGWVAAAMVAASTSVAVAMLSGGLAV